jgi:hypothetical protein
MEVTILLILGESGHIYTSLGLGELGIITQGSKEKVEVNDLA